MGSMLAFQPVVLVPHRAAHVTLLLPGISWMGADCMDGTKHRSKAVIVDMIESTNGAKFACGASEGIS